MSHSPAASSDVRRFGYYIPYSNGKVDFAVSTKVLDTEVLAELNRITGVIWVVQPILIAFEVVENNFRELVDSLELHREKLSKLGSPVAISILLHLKGSVFAAQRVTNFLSSASAFLAQAQKKMEDTANISEDWDEKRKDNHAKFFSFRFLYVLRNFSQHYALPFSGLSVASERTTQKEHVNFNVKIMIDRDALLSTSYRWKKLEEEIKRQPPEFDLTPLISEYCKILRGLCREAVKYYRDQLAECNRYFKKLRQILKIPHNGVPVIFVGDPPNTKTPPQIYQALPFENLIWIINMLYRLSKHQ